MKHYLNVLLVIAWVGGGGSPQARVEMPGDSPAATTEYLMDGGSVADQHVSQLSTPAPPVIVSPAGNSRIDRFPLLSGTGIPGATVRVVRSYTANPVLATTTVGGNGRWEVRSGLVLPVGFYSITSQQTVAGRVSDWGVNIGFTVVDTPSVPVINNPVPNSRIDRYPLLSGQGIPGATVRVVRSHTANPVLATTTVSANGHWEVRSGLVLPVGSYSITSQQTLDGKISDWGVNIAFTVIDTPPVPVIKTPVQNSSSDRRPLLSGTGIPGATLQVVRSHTASPVLATTTVGANGHWEVHSSPELPLGSYSITSQQTLDGKVSGWGLNIPFTVTNGISEGQRVADELNQLYSATSNACPGNMAAFYCSGVLIRTVDDSTAFHAWNPSPSAINLGGVSFSYMRVDIGMNRLQGGRTQGFVLEPGQSFIANGGYLLQVLCSFPYDGESLRRGSNGCGASSEFPQNSGPCAAQNITTLAAWRTHFEQYKTAPDRYRHQCGYGADQSGFALSLAARENPDAETQAWQQNEIVIKTWPQNIPNLPIKAFFYYSTASRAVGIEGAKNIQRDFLKTTGRRIPVVRITPNVTTGNIFSYFAADQGI